MKNMWCHQHCSLKIRFFRVAPPGPVKYRSVQLVWNFNIWFKAWFNTWFEWVSVVTWATDIKTDPSCSRTKYQDMTISSNLGGYVIMIPDGSVCHSDRHRPSSNIVVSRLQHGLGWQRRPGSHTTFDGNRSCRH